MVTPAVHSLVPKLPVSPSRSPSWRAAKVVAAMEDCEVVVTKKRLPIIYCLYDTREQEDAGSTLAAGLRGPKSGVHFTAARSRSSRRARRLAPHAPDVQGPNPRADPAPASHACRVHELRTARPLARRRSAARSCAESSRYSSSTSSSSSSSSSSTSSSSSSSTSSSSSSTSPKMSSGGPSAEAAAGSSSIPGEHRKPNADRRCPSRRPGKIAERQGRA